VEFAPDLPFQSMQALRPSAPEQFQSSHALSYEVKMIYPGEKSLRRGGFEMWSSATSMTREKKVHDSGTLRGATIHPRTDS
jgi:hypothetical protein